jgi:hypothetical protein
MNEEEILKAADEIRLRRSRLESQERCARQNEFYQQLKTNPLVYEGQVHLKNDDEGYSAGQNEISISNVALSLQDYIDKLPLGKKVRITIEALEG